MKIKNFCLGNFLLFKIFTYFTGYMYCVLMEQVENPRCCDTAKSKKESA